MNLLLETFFNIPYTDGLFDIVMCNNLILHLPLPITKALDELIRISKKCIIIRTVFGERNYIIKEIRETSDNEEIISKDGQIVDFNYFNIYTEKY